MPALSSIVVTSPWRARCDAVRSTSRAPASGQNRDSVRGSGLAPHCETPRCGADCLAVIASSKPTRLHRTPLLRELILAFLEIPRADAGSAHAERLIPVILGQLQASPIAPLSLPSPASERLRSIASDIRDEPGADWPLDALASRAAMSPAASSAISNLRQA
jgi:hypothetical protein